MQTDDLNIYRTQDNGATWPVTDTLLISDNPTFTSVQGQLIRINDGNLMVVTFADRLSSGNYEYHLRSCPTADSANECLDITEWGNDLNLSQVDPSFEAKSGASDKAPSLSCDFNSTNHLHCLFSTGQPYGVVHIYMDSELDTATPGNWVITDVNVANNGASRTDRVGILIDSNDMINATYIEGNENYFYSRRPSDLSLAWMTPFEVSSGETGITDTTSMDVGPDGNVVYTYSGTDGTLKLWFKEFDGTTLGPRIQIPLRGAGASNAFIAVDSNNNNHIIFDDRTGAAADRNISRVIIWDANQIVGDSIDVNSVTGPQGNGPLSSNLSRFNENNIALYNYATDEYATLGYDVVRGNIISTGIPPGVPAVGNSPDVNITLIDGKGIGDIDNNFGYDRDENLTITFTVIDLDQDDLNFNLWYGTSKSAKTNIIVQDLNLSTNECGGEDWTSTQTCTFDFNIISTLVADNNYFLTVDLNDSANVDTNSHDVSFVVDNTDPFTHAVDYNQGIWQNNNASQVLSCIDPTAGCFITQYRLDTDDTNAISMGAWTVYSSAIAINNDGNFSLDINSTDRSGNMEDTNRLHYPIDKIAPFTLAVDHNYTTELPPSDTTLTCSDATSGCNITQYRLDTDDTNAVSMGAWTLFTTPINIAVDGNFALDINSSDLSGLLEDTNRLYISLLTPSPPPNLAPSITVIAPNGGENFDNRITTNVSIIFNVTDPDDNSLLVDINFHINGNQGNGTVIINDINTDSATISCVDSDFSNATACTYLWNIDSVADGNYFALVAVTDGNTSVFDASNASFGFFTTTLPTRQLLSGTPRILIALIPLLTASLFIFLIVFVFKREVNDPNSNIVTKTSLLGRVFLASVVGLLIFIILYSFLNAVLGATT